MKKRVLLSSIVMGLLLGMNGQAQESKAISPIRKLPYWQDVNVVKVNKEHPRTQFMTFDTKEEALNKRFEESEYYISLNGTWKFYFVDGYKELPENITDSTVSMEGWKEIKVPGNWEMQGFGTAIYVNHPYEFVERDPRTRYQNGTALVTRGEPGGRVQKGDRYSGRLEREGDFPEHRRCEIRSICLYQR